jgi:hypothetical protein
MDTTKPQYMQKFRQSRTRCDYFPSGAALAAINRLREQFPDLTMRETLDALVIAGGKGNFQRRKVGDQP